MAYRRWLSTLAFEHPAQQIAFQDYVDAVTDAERRLKGVEEQILKLIPAWSLCPVVDALQAVRGIALVTAVILVAEVGDFTRFANPRQLMAYFGLVPGERSSGETTRRGGITKTGNSYARKALVEGALAYRMKPRVGRHKVDRIEALPKWFATSPGRRRSVCAPATANFLRAAKLPTSSQSLSLARWWASSGRSPAWFNPRQKRRDKLTANGRRRPKKGYQTASAQYAALGAEQCRGALACTMSLQRSPARQRQPQTKQGHAARPADESLLTDVHVPLPATHTRRTTSSAVDRSRRAKGYAKSPCRQS
jgi:hypothetical protein